MRFALSLAALTLFLAACSEFANTVDGDVRVPKSNGPNPNGLPDPNNVPKPGGGSNGYAVSRSPVVFNEILVDPVGANGGAQYVELYNASDFDADIGGWIITDGASTYTLPYGARIGAKGMTIVHLGRSGTATAGELFAPSFGELSTQIGALALLRSGADVADFVQWGGTPNVFETEASNVLEWAAGDFVGLGPEGTSISYDGSASDSSAWRVTVTTPGR
jgi:hypothetical protein